MNKKVLMIIPRLAGGGAERVVSNLTLQLKDKYETDVLVDYDDISYPCSGEIICLNPGMKESSGKWNEFYTYFCKYRLLRKLKRKKTYDCYVSHSKVSHILNVMTGNKNGKTILTLHNKSTNMQSSRFRTFLNFFARHYYSKADLLVAVSEGVREEYIRDYHIPPQKIISIWNGSDISLIREKSEEPLSTRQEAWFQKGKTVTTMGRFCEQKGQWHLIRAFSEVVKRFPDSRLLLLGEGPLEGPLKQTAEKMHIDGNVIFCGFQKNPFSVIARSDLFVFPSLWEGFGYALEEAICCGTPCISSDFEYGAREILRYTEGADIKETAYTEYGALVPVCRERSMADGPLTEEEHIMADCIQNMLADQEYCRKIVRNNRVRLEEFSLERMGEKWEEAIG